MVLGGGWRSVSRYGCITLKAGGAKVSKRVTPERYHAYLKKNSSSDYEKKAAAIIYPPAEAPERVVGYNFRDNSPQICGRQISSGIWWSFAVASLFSPKRLKSGALLHSILCLCLILWSATTASNQLLHLWCVPLPSFGVGVLELNVVFGEHLHVAFFRVVKFDGIA
jgi:hypothetical protein